MELNDFFKNYKRMCSHSGGCLRCPMNDRGSNDLNCQDFVFAHPDKAERIVFNWKEEHPLITNADKFREIFGTIIVGVPTIIAAASQVSVNGKSLNKWANEEYHPPKNKDM